MNPQIVSDSLESDVIQERIVLNLYENPIVICDVSGLNPNVMFELGMRLTFKKPTIIITDDISSLPFDTKIIEHIPYPRDLHFHLMEEFISILCKKIVNLREKLRSGSYKSFIESFGTFETATPDKEVVPIDKYVLDRLDRISASIRQIERSQSVQASEGNLGRYISGGINAVSMTSPDREKVYAIKFREHDDIENTISRVSAFTGVESVETNVVGPDKAIVIVNFHPTVSRATRRHVDDIFSRFLG
jgi:hypothetical protein